MRKTLGRPSRPGEYGAANDVDDLLSSGYCDRRSACDGRIALSTAETDVRGGPPVRSETEIQARLEALEEDYNRLDPPSSPTEEELEVAILRAIEELEWVLGQRDVDEGFTT